MWISAPTPVINSTKHIDSGSTSSPKFTCSPPTGTQENPSRWIARSFAVAAEQIGEQHHPDRESAEHGRAAQQMSPPVGAPASQQQHHRPKQRQRQQQPRQIAHISA